MTAPIVGDVLPLELSTLSARMEDARSTGSRLVYSGNNVLEVAETMGRKLKNCVDALTFCIDGWDETDPYIIKLRLTRDRALELLTSLKAAS